MKKNLSTAIVLMGTVAAANAASNDSAVNNASKDINRVKVEMTDFNLNKDQVKTKKLNERKGLTYQEGTALCDADDASQDKANGKAVRQSKGTVKQTVASVRDNQSVASDINRSLWQRTKDAVKGFGTMIKESWLAQGETVYNYGSYGYTTI